MPEYKAVDCHAHFYTPNYTADDITSHIASKIQLNNDNDGEISLLAVIVTPETHQEALEVVGQGKLHPLLKPCVGLHPVQHVMNTAGEKVSISARPSSQLDQVLALIEEKGDEVVAVGEIGLDFSPWILETSAKMWDCSVDEVKHLQRQVFIAQVELAKKLDLAVNVHSRNAGHHAIGVLEERGMLARSLLHAFDGAPKHAVRAAQLGAMFSVPGSIARDASCKKL
ncbi:UNVERIFIED_CONTAM: putative deoxyribonuclease tatdn3, partial [Siphonaria sp. JEL0065]